MINGDQDQLMRRDFQVRPYENGDEAGIVELLKQALPDWAKMKAPIDYWKWKYLDCPNGSIKIVAVSEGKIVGCNHAILTNIKVGDRTFSGRYGDDAATHLDYRGLGVYSSVLDATIEEAKKKLVEINYDVPISDLVIGNHLKRGRKIFPHNISHMLKVNDVKKYFKKAPIKNAELKRFAFDAIKGVKSLSGKLRDGKHANGDFTVSENLSFDGKIDLFYDELKDSYKFMVERKSTYLNWRYREPIDGSTVVKQAINGDRVLGYSVLQLKTSGYSPQGYIADLLALPGRDDVALSLLRDACAYFDGAGINAVNYRVVAGHNYNSLASSVGFIDVRGNLPMMMELGSEAVKAEFKRLEESSPKWVYFTYGDYY